MITSLSSNFIKTIKPKITLMGKNTSSSSPALIANQTDVFESTTTLANVQLASHNHRSGSRLLVDLPYSFFHTPLVQGLEKEVLATSAQFDATNIAKVMANKSETITPENCLKTVATAMFDDDNAVPIAIAAIFGLEPKFEQTRLLKNALKATVAPSQQGLIEVLFDQVANFRHQHFTHPDFDTLLPKTDAEDMEIMQNAIETKLSTLLISKAKLIAGAHNYSGQGKSDLRSLKVDFRPSLKQGIRTTLVLDNFTEFDLAIARINQRTEQEQALYKIALPSTTELKACRQINANADVALMKMIHFELGIKPVKQNLTSLTQAEIAQIAARFESARKSKQN